ncbi:MAG: Eco29kI family restriction endonuclease [Acidobacteriota bacterium]|nr:Eco29kI family restriction endonuclease [Acidobacteriota bacterium]
MADAPFNPLDKLNLAESLAEAMLKQPVTSLPPENRFDGAGIYAIYYQGDFEAYRRIAEKNTGDNPSAPIYVGKAVPPGARKGGFGLGAEPRNALFKRLKEHARSIQETGNLQPEDFRCRYLVCDDIWIPLGEALLIEKFKPVWNVLIEGFGIHTPGGGRKKQVRSKWDTLHPGRKLARDLPTNPMSRSKILSLLSDFLAGKKVPTLSARQAVLEQEGEQ